MPKARYVTRNLYLALRGPIATLKEHVLPEYIYERAANIGILQLFLGENSHIAAKAALDCLVTESSAQKLPQIDDNSRELMGPWQAFGALAIDGDMNATTMHRKHANIKACKELVEDIGVLTYPSKCVNAVKCATIAGRYQDVRRWSLDNFIELGSPMRYEKGAMGGILKFESYENADDECVDDDYVKYEYEPDDHGTTIAGYYQDVKRCSKNFSLGMETKKEQGAMDGYLRLASTSNPRIEFSAYVTPGYIMPRIFSHCEIRVSC